MPRTERLSHYHETKNPVTELAIREATDADAARLATLYRDAYGALAERGFPSSAAETDEDDVREWLREREVFVGTDPDESVVGAVQIRERPEWPAPELCRLAVDPDRQREGIGATLLGYAEELIGSQGHDRVRLRTFTGHPFLLAWYERRGYRQVDLQRIESRPFDAPMMEREL